MTTETIVLVGGPDTGKTNFIARLWECLRGNTGVLHCPTPSDDIEYIENALNHLLRGTFAPRSNQNIVESRSNVTIPVRLAQQKEGDATVLLMPDVTGELWKTAIETREVPREWMADLHSASGAILFVRVLSDQIRAPLDWITSRALMKGGFALLPDQEGLPTQVALCELLRFLETTLKRRTDGSKPRVAICVTAYDRLDRKTAALGPEAYLRKEYPLFDGRLSDTTDVETRAFGVSVVGGDLSIDSAFRDRFLQGDFAQAGYVVTTSGSEMVKHTDISLPLAWLIEGQT